MLHLIFYSLLNTLDCLITVFLLHCITSHHILESSSHQVIQKTKEWRTKKSVIHFHLIRSLCTIDSFVINLFHSLYVGLKLIIIKRYWYNNSKIQELLAEFSLWQKILNQSIQSSDLWNIWCFTHCSLHYIAWFLCGF